MAISVRRPDADALSDLAHRVVGAVRAPEAAAADEDPFTLALKRYQSAGAPAELRARWRDALTEGAKADVAAASSVLRRLDRDLLSGVVRYATDVAPAEPEEESANERAGEAAPLPSLRVVTDATALPALVMGSDGTFHADDARPAGTAAPRGRLASLTGMASRYPDPAAMTARRRPLLERIGPEAASAAVAARVKTVAPPPAFFPPTAAELLPLDEEVRPAANDELLQTVSGGIELVVGPFTRLQQLAAFTRALREMPGVEDVSARQFAKGSVHIRVHYADAIPLSNRLAQLREFSPSVVSASKTRIELKVEPPDDAPATT